MRLSNCIQNNLLTSMRTGSTAGRCDNYLIVCVRLKKDWAALGIFLSNNPEALMIELKSEVGKARYASYWRFLKEGTHNNTMYDIETALPAFAMSESELMTLDHVFLIGDFLKEYCNAYEAALSVFRVVLRSGSDQSIFNDNFRIKDSRELDCMSRIGDIYTFIKI